MITFDKTAIHNILLEEGYSDESEIEMIFYDLSVIDASLQGVLDAYLTERIILDEFNVEGLTINIIMDKFRCDFWNALGFLNTSISNHKLARDLYNL